jgi:hypothetical protein
MSDEPKKQSSPSVPMAVAAGLIIVGTVGAITAMMYGIKRLTEQDQPQQPCGAVVERPAACPVADLNGDTLPDMLLYLGDGRKVPLYGFSQLGEDIPASYQPASFMRATFPDSPVDYEGIEARLNQQ